MKTILSLLTLASLALAEVRLVWDANPEPNVTYQLSYGVAAGVRPSLVAAGALTEIPLPNIEAGVPYFFAVQASLPTGETSEPSEEISYTRPKPNPLGWVIQSVDSEEINGYAAELAIDGDSQTFWHTPWRVESEKTQFPHDLRVDMIQSKWLGGFTYLPRQDHWSGSDIRRYDFYVSLDGMTWDLVATGEFLYGKQLTAVSFPPRAARFFRLVSHSNQGVGLADSSSSIAELSVTFSASSPMVWIQKSTDLVHWENVVQIPYVQPRQFIRMEIPSTP